MEVFSNEKDDRELNAKELHNSIRAHSKKVSLLITYLISMMMGSVVWVTILKACLI